MRHLFALFLAITFLSASVARAQSAPQAAAGLTVIRAGTLIDGTSAAPRKNQLIFVRGDRIEKVADGSAAIPADVKVITLGGVIREQLAPKGGVLRIPVRPWEIVTLHATR